MNFEQTPQQHKLPFEGYKRSIYSPLQGTQILRQCSHAIVVTKLDDGVAFRSHPLFFSQCERSRSSRRVQSERPSRNATRKRRSNNPVSFAHCKYCTASTNNFSSAAFTTRLNRYRDENHLALIQPLIDKDLSEPYSIFTYRYFISQWPHLCFLAMHENECVGAVVCKLVSNTFPQPSQVENVIEQEL